MSLYRTQVIIGAVGRVGREHLNYSLASGIRCIPVSRSGQKSDFPDSPLIETTINLDLNSPDWGSLEKVLDRDDLTIVYLASRKAPGLEIPHGKRGEYQSINVSHVKRLVELAKNKKNIIIYPSSDHVFGWQHDERASEEDILKSARRFSGFSEDDVPQHSWGLFGHSKLAGEREVLDHEKGYVVRFGQILGHNNDIVSDIIRNLRKGQGCSLHNNVLHKYAGINQVCLTLNRVVEYCEKNDLTTDSTQDKVPDSFGKRKIFHVAFDDGPMSLYELLMDLALRCERRGNIPRGSVSKIKGEAADTSNGTPRVFALNTDLTKKELKLQKRLTIPSLLDRRAQGYLVFD